MRKSNLERSIVPRFKSTEEYFASKYVIPLLFKSGTSKSSHGWHIVRVPYTNYTCMCRIFKGMVLLRKLSTSMTPALKPK